MIFPIVYRGSAYPYLTVFNSKFGEIQQEKKLHAVIFGATNPLFLKSQLPLGCVLRLDGLTAVRPQHHKQPPKPFQAHYQTLVRYPVNFKNYIVEGASEETTAINSCIVRQKLLMLTLDFLEPVQAYFQTQYNVR